LSTVCGPKCRNVAAVQDSAAAADTEVVLTVTLVVTSLVAVWGGIVPVRRRTD
jgi:hypothetical protein